jgi:hypothetical protein
MSDFALPASLPNIYARPRRGSPTVIAGSKFMPTAQKEAAAGINLQRLFGTNS